MFQWIENIEKRLHSFENEAKAEIAALKARVDALEGKTAPAAPVEPPPVEAPAVPSAPESA